ncbi:MAG TPA: DinB family protein [Chryseosolibacter sp.]
MRPQLETVSKFYQGYVKNVMDLDMFDALRQSSRITLDLIRTIPESKGEFRYAEGKWSIKELLAHMIDTERIMAYRALRFARNDKTDLPGFEEKDYAPEANAHGRTIAQLADEMERLRATTIDMFESFTPEMLTREGTANKNLLSVLVLGYVIPGHETHHRKILIERYLKP